MSDDSVTPTFWAISGESLLTMLREVAAGADPDIVYAEHYANSGHDGTCMDCGHEWLVHGDMGCSAAGCRCTEPGCEEG